MCHARRLQVRHACDSQLLVQHLDLLRAQRWNIHQRQQTFRNRCAQFLVIFQPPRRHQLTDLLLQRLADPGQFAQPVFRDKLRHIPIEIIQRPRPIRIRPRLERILALQLQQDGDLLQNIRDLRFIHASKN